MVQSSIVRAPAARGVQRSLPSAPLRAQVAELLAAMYPASPLERRREQRYPYPRLLQLTPVDESGQPNGLPMTAAGKQISESGLSFFHPEPLAYRRVVVVLERMDGPPVRLLLDVDRCRFTRLGWYESGGRFLRWID